MANALKPSMCVAFLAIFRGFFHGFFIVSQRFRGRKWEKTSVSKALLVVERPELLLLRQRGADDRRRLALAAHVRQRPLGHDIGDLTMLEAKPRKGHLQVTLHGFFMVFHGFST